MHTSQYANSPGPGPAAVGSPPNVGEELDRAHKAALGSRELIERLEGRLQPVLAPQGPQVATDNLRQPERPAAPLGQSARAVWSMTEESNGLLQRLMDRLEI